MKNLFLILLSITFSVQVGISQEAEKDMKKAGKMLGRYHLDPSSNAGDLTEAQKLIDNAMSSGELNGNSEAWITKGEIYNALAAEDAKNTVLNPQAKVEGHALTAFDAFKNGIDKSDKKWATKSALKGMAETSGHLNTIGYTQYQQQNYELAYKHFESVLKVNDILKKNEMDGVLGTEEALLDQYYITAVSAMSANNMDVAAKYFQILDEKNFDKPIVYEGLYKAYINTDEEKALGYLAKGREKFTGEDAKALLFTEINHYLQKGELESLIEKLETAAELEPNNASIFTTLGNVYDQQYQTALDSQNFKKAENLFLKARINYDKALEIEPGDFAATYSTGALYYNKAAAVSQIVNTLADDYSKEGTQRYEAKKAEMDELFNKALPWFEKAEKINPNDLNTMIALKEIHARQNNFEKSNEYKAKIEAVNN